VAVKEVLRLVGWLEDLGFLVEMGGKHYSVTHPSHPGRATVPVSPSDHRWLDNQRSSLRKTFPGILDRSTMTTFPGSRSSPRSSVHAQVPGDRIVLVLEQLTGARGDRPFAGKLCVDEQHGAKRLTIKNPFFTNGSDDPVRAQRTTVILLGQPNQLLGPVAVEALRNVGVDLELPTLVDLEWEFLTFAREQRTMGRLEHKRWQAECKIARDESMGRATGRVVEGAKR
jgi:hypothetical protein